MFSVASVSDTVSVVIPTYNDGEFLETCLSSLARQTEPPYEVIVVDDGSTSPSSLAGIERAIRRFPTTRIIRQSNAGPSSARNRGIAECKGTLIMFLDCDDRVAPTAVADKRGLFSQAVAAVAAYGGIEFIDHHGSSRFSRYLEYAGPLEPSRLGNIDGHPGVLWAYLFRADALRSVGGLDESLEIMEDFDLLLRLGLAGGTFVGCNKPLHIQNRHLNSITRASARRQVRGALRFLHKARKRHYFGKAELVRRYLQVPRGFLKTILYKVR